MGTDGVCIRSGCLAISPMQQEHMMTLFIQRQNIQNCDIDVDMYGWGDLFDLPEWVENEEDFADFIGLMWG